jgi:hypothetical protein
MMKRVIALVLGALAILTVASSKPAEAACVSWVPGHWVGGYWSYAGWVRPYWAPAQCAAFAPGPAFVTPAVVVARPYWRPWGAGRWGAGWWCYRHPYRC